MAPFSSEQHLHAPEPRASPADSLKTDEKMDGQLSRVQSGHHDAEKGADDRAPHHNTNLKIRFSPLNMALICFMIMCTAPAWAGTLATALTAGGPVTMVYGFLAVFVASLCGSASLAEMVSIWPTAEGQILWAEQLAPLRCRSFIRYYVAWLAVLAWIFISASSCFVTAISITAIANACNPDYLPERWHTCLIFWALILVALAFNIYGIRFFAALNNIVTAVVISAVVVTVILLLAKHEGGFNSASFVFTEEIDGTGWNNRGMAFIIGMVSAAYSILGYDSVAHLSEEMHEPARYAPRAMIGSVLMSLPTGLLIILAVLFTIKDIDVIAQQLFPILYILQQTTKSTAGAVVLTFALSTFSSFCATTSILATSGRVIWSFALEGGIPFSSVFARVSSKHHVPIAALCVSVAVQMLLVLIYIGNAALFNSILVLAVAHLNISYAIPNALMLFRGRPSGTLPLAPFTLGPILGPLCNVVAVLYEVFISIMLFFPTVRPVTPSNMNWAVAICGGAHLVLGVYWFCGGKTRVHSARNEHDAAEGAQRELDERKRAGGMGSVRRVITGEVDK
ncbi:hypothetical protein JCM10207_003214 [Rhodosporidiobolus poonsookiae]